MTHKTFEEIQWEGFSHGFTREQQWFFTALRDELLRSVPAFHMLTAAVEVTLVVHMSVDDVERWEDAIYETEALIRERYPTVRVRFEVAEAGTDD